jgi:hypothetical protein
MKYELKDYLPEVKKKEEPEVIKITITVPREEYEDIDNAVKLSGRAGDTPTAYGKAAFSLAASRARGFLNQTKQNEGNINEYEKCSE